MIVYCNMNCINQKNGECDLDEIQMGNMCECVDYEEFEEPEPERPDKYYALVHSKSDMENLKSYHEDIGIKEIYRGRDIFVKYPNDDIFTDGRTGMLAKRSFLDKKTDEEMSKLFEEIEQKEGLTPLYKESEAKT